MFLGKLFEKSGNFKTVNEETCSNVFSHIKTALFSLAGVGSASE